MKRYIKEYITAGVHLSNGLPVFNWNHDDPDDILFLKNVASGEITEDGIQYIYGYEYNPQADPKDIKVFRQFIKGLNSESKAFFTEPVEDLIENAIFALNDYHKLSDFKAIVHSGATSKKLFTVSDIINSYMMEYCRNAWFSFELIKQTYADVEFNAQEAKVALQSKGFSSDKIDQEIEFTVNKFNSLKQSGELFQMKRFIPKEIRAAFHNFLKFKTDEERKVYETLQGVDVLIYDDFLTSGATVKEIIRYLKSFNDNNTLTVFVLIKQ